VIVAAVSFSWLLLLFVAVIVVVVVIDNDDDGGVGLNCLFYFVLFCFPSGFVGE
jgi:archaellum biogenesis protein FlaJ (TadC family)